MKVSPSTRAVTASAAWTLGGLAVLLLPSSWPLLAAAGLGLLALMLSDLRRLRRLTLPSIERVLPSRGHVGLPSRVFVRIRNGSSVPIELDLVDEAPADLVPSSAADEAALGRGPADGGSEPTIEPRFEGVRIGPQESTECSYEVVPSRRGDRQFGRIVAQVHSPMGFWRRRVENESEAALRVYPDATRFLRPEALSPRRVFESIGVRPARRRGDGMEFESLRDYVDGDDPRRLDWAASARRGRPITRLYQHERNHTVVIAIDASRLMGGRAGARSKLDHAIDAALALAYAGLASGDRVGMSVFDSAVRGHLTPRARRAELGIFVDFVRAVQPRLVEADYAALLKSLMVHQRQRALVVVLTDFVEASARDLTTPLDVLRRRHQVLLVALRDPVYGEVDTEAGREDRGGLYRRLVLEDLLDEREQVLAGLRRRGVHTLDLEPEAVTAAVLNRYLAIRYGPER